MKIQVKFRVCSLKKDMEIVTNTLNMSPPEAGSEGPQEQLVQASTIIGHLEDYFAVKNKWSK